MHKFFGSPSQILSVGALAGFQDR